MGCKFHILLIDDSDAVRRLLTSVLTAAGFEVVACEGVNEALNQLRSFMPDVILTDFNMPILNGEILVREVRRNPRFADTPIVVISSETAIETRLRMAAAGANGWLGKPIDPTALLQTVQSICEAQRSMNPRTPRPNAVARVHHVAI